MFFSYHCQRSSPSQISDTPLAGFEPGQNLSLGLVKWSYAVVMTTTSQQKIKNPTWSKYSLWWWSSPGTLANISWIENAVDSCTNVRQLFGLSPFISHSNASNSKKKMTNSQNNIYFWQSFIWLKTFNFLFQKYSIFYSEERGIPYKYLFLNFKNNNLSISAKSLNNICKVFHFFYWRLAAILKHEVFHKYFSRILPNF